jgi:uncharacterized membrane protein YhaH (DUF805 family)
VLLKLRGRTKRYWTFITIIVIIFLLLLGVNGICFVDHIVLTVIFSITTASHVWKNVTQMLLVY